MKGLETPAFDAVVVGAGPAGCAAAITLAQAGRPVLLLDRDPEPRFKIGESLLPWSLPLFEKLGLGPRIEAAGFMRKYGAKFWNEITGGTRQVLFSDALDRDHPTAWQVQRKTFDGLMADHAAAAGAVVRRGVAVEELLMDGQRATGVRLRGADGGEEIRARVVLDATGQAALIASRMKIREGDPKLRRAALYAHYRGVWRGPGERAGDILLPFLPNVWYWAIPFADGTTSVGAVFDPAAAPEGRTPEERLDALLGRSTKMTEFVAGAERLSPVQGASDYSITAKRFAGDGWALCGDAAAFLDPVFSTGVHLGVSAGHRAALAVDRALAAKGRVDAADFAEYEKVTRRMVDAFKPFVYGFYDPHFARMFCEKEPFGLLRRAVTSTLAGNVERPSLAVRFWKQAVLWSVWITRPREAAANPAAAAASGM